MDELKKSANKSDVFHELGDAKIIETIVSNDKEIVDTFVKHRREPTVEETQNWS